MGLRFKKALRWWPEFILVAIIIQYWISTGILLNPISILLLGALITLLILNKRSLGLFISIVLTGLSCYLWLALFSDIADIDVFDNDAFKFVVFGCLYMGLTSAASLAMLHKYIFKDSIRNEIEM